MDKMAEEVLKARFEEVAAAPQGKGEALAAALFKDLVDTADFDNAFKAVYRFQELLGAKLQPVAVRDALRTTTKDRQTLSFIDSVFDSRTRSLKECAGRLNRLLSFAPGARVLSQAWGLGQVKRIDHFYRRIVVDFAMRRGHQLTYDAACETLVLAPEGHILVTQASDPARIEQMLKEKKGEFLKAMLVSFGDMPVTRLEELCVQYGFVKAANWKKFWEAARVELRQDKTVEIPTRRAEPIHVKQKAEDYGEDWYGAFEQMKDPKSILSSVRELQNTKEYKALKSDDAALKRKAVVADRLAFALKGAKGVDAALFARIAFSIDELKLDGFLLDDRHAHAQTAKSRAYLWALDENDEERYLVAARTLPARETGRLVEFLASSSETDEERAKAEVDEAKARLFAALPRMCFPFLSETVAAFVDDPACEAAVVELLKKPDAPATLVTLVLGRYEGFKKWASLPPLVVILTHAIALGEGKQGGETLRMQNVVRRLFADQKWLEGVFAQLQPADQALFFERFQASIAWDPSTHHMIVVRMTKIVPQLASRLAKKEAVRKVERITSLRSYAECQAAYEKLIKVDIPENTKRIEFAKSYGDLSENAEYQYAKDEQRALLQKQTLLQGDLNAVKAVDFSDVDASVVRPGTTVRIVTSAGETRVYTVLGEWDNDLERGIISNKTKLAENMLGKKAGDTFDLPDAEGGTSVATISAVEPLTDELRAWIKATPAA